MFYLWKCTSFHVNVTRNVQPLQEYYIFIAVIYLIILFRMVNLEMLENMESHSINFTFPIASALDFLFDHTIHCLDGLAFTGFAV